MQESVMFGMAPNIGGPVNVGNSGGRGHTLKRGAAVQYHGRGRLTSRGRGVKRTGGRGKVGSRGRGEVDNRGRRGVGNQGRGEISAKERRVLLGNPPKPGRSPGQ